MNASQQLTIETEEKFEDKLCKMCRVLTTSFPLFQNF